MAKDDLTLGDIEARLQAVTEQHQQYLDAEMDGIRETAAELLPEAKRQWEAAAQKLEAHGGPRQGNGGIAGMLNRASGGGVVDIFSRASGGGIATMLEKGNGGGIATMLEKGNGGGIGTMLDGGGNAAWQAKHQALVARERELASRYQTLQRLANGRGVAELAAKRVAKNHPEIKAEMKPLRAQEQKLKAQETLKAFRAKQDREREQARGPEQSRGR